MKNSVGYAVFLICAFYFFRRCLWNRVANSKGRSARAASLKVCFLAFFLFGLIESYLVDPASSHMLCSRIKPCMSKYEHVLYCETADSSLYQL